MGGFLTIGYCSRTIGYCFPYCFLEIFAGDKTLMERDKVMMGAPPVPPTRKNPGVRGFLIRRFSIFSCEKQVRAYQKLCLNQFQIVTTLIIFHEKKYVQKRHQEIQSYYKHCSKR